MAEPATRVALLARPGAACDNLQAALRQAGADVVAVQDPASGDPAAVSAAHPSAVLVALEPAVEEALERYDAVLSAPGRLVIYDEVAIAAKREGWDAARWARHLAAKLGGHGDVLPPGAGDDEGAGIAMPTVPARADHAPAVPAASFASGEAPAAFDAESVHLGVASDHSEVLASAGAGIDFGGFTPEMMAAMAMEPPAPPVREADAGPVGEPEAGFPASEPEPEPARELEAAPELEPEQPLQPAGTDDANVLEWEPSAPIATPRAAAPPAAPSAGSAPAPSMRLSADEMTLVDIDPGHGAQAASSAPFATSPGGGVVVLAGIGGPDAVRQLLSALPGGFARPIVIRQRLDGGRHDRLVRQMQRATSLPVELAEAGRLLMPGHVYILPDGVATSGDAAARFVSTEAPVPVLAGLPAGDSAVLVLSGSDPASVPEVMEAARDGAFVAGQSPDDSFDGAAAAALVAAGGESCTAAELAQRVSARWNS